MNFLEAVTDYMAGAADFREMAVSKIASLEQENKKLRHTQVTAKAFKELVAKLASAGLVDVPNKAYFDRNTSDRNVGQQMEKLSALFNQEVTVNKQASVNSPYKVKKQINKIERNEADEQFNARIRNLRPS